MRELALTKLDLRVRALLVLRGHVSRRRPSVAGPILPASRHNNVPLAVDGGSRVMLDDGAGGRAWGRHPCLRANPVLSKFLCGERLTAPYAVTEDTEKAAVFLYSKLEQGAADRRFDWTPLAIMLHYNVMFPRHREMPHGRAGSSENG